MRQLIELIALFILCFIGHGYAVDMTMLTSMHVILLALLTIGVLALLLANTPLRILPHAVAIGVFVSIHPSTVFVPPLLYAVVLSLVTQLRSTQSQPSARLAKPDLQPHSTQQERRAAWYQQAGFFFVLGVYLWFLLAPATISSVVLALFATYLAYNTYSATVEANTTNVTVDDMREQVIELTTMSSQLSLAAEKDREIAVLQERDRIARRLHDSVGHTISSSLIQLQALDVQVEEPLVKDGIKRIQTTLSQGMQAIRAQLYDLRDTAFDAEQTLQTIAQEITRPQIQLHYGLQSCSYATKQQLVLFAKEAIANAIKHSDATELRIVLTSNQAMHIMTIKDNGTVEPPRITPGIGLGNMQTFAQEHNGQCTYHYHNGFAIHLYIERQDDAPHAG